MTLSDVRMGVSVCRNEKPANVTYRKTGCCVPVARVQQRPERSGDFRYYEHKVLIISHNTSYPPQWRRISFPGFLFHYPPLCQYALAEEIHHPLRAGNKGEVLAGSLISALEGLLFDQRDPLTQRLCNTFRICVAEVSSFENLMMEAAGAGI